MKKSLVIIFTVSMLFLFSVSSLAAIHPMKESLGMNWSPTIDTWFSVEKEKPYFEGYYWNVNRTPSVGCFGGEYFENDQTFINGTFISTNGSSLNNISGSFLLDMGLFVGLSYTSTSSFNSTTIAPGYRYNFCEEGYAAFSFNYMTDNLSSTNKVMLYDLDFKYNPENMKVIGEVTFPDGKDTSIGLKGNFALSDNVVVGAGFASQGSTSVYNAGLTYKAEPIVIDAIIGQDFPTVNYYALSGMYKINQFGIGILYQKFDNANDPYLELKTKYSIDNASLIFKYSPKNDSYYQSITVGLQMNL